VSIAGAGLVGTAPSSPTGAMTIGANDAGPHDVTLSGPAIITRTTQLRLPAPDAKVTLIPAGFDVPAFDQLCRQPAIHRWLTPPPVVVEARVLQFTSLADAALPATTVSQDDGPTRQMALDMQSVLADLTGGHFTSLASIAVQRSAAGAAVPIMTSGRVTVARVTGMFTATGYGGFTRWEIGPAGNIQSASILLDTQFDNATSGVATVLRMHEFGHALGLTHVLNRPSLMNPSANAGPTPFDRDATRIAWERPIGNQSPDNDPSGASINRLGRPYWTNAEGVR